MLLVISTNWFSNVLGGVTGNFLTTVYPVCGSATTLSHEKMPTTNLCAKGIVGNSGDAGDGRWFWACVGNNTGWGNGDTAWCFANKTIPNNIYISSCTTLKDSGKTYVLKKDLYSKSSCIRINASNITLDGAGYSISGDNSGLDYGIYSNGFENITIKNFKQISGFYNGIYLTSTKDSKIFNNSFKSNTYTGINLAYKSSGNDIRLNNFLNNNIAGMYIYDSSNNVVNKNYFSENPKYGLILSENSNKNIVSDNFVSKSSLAGIYSYKSLLNYFENNYFDDLNGYELFVSDNIKILCNLDSDRKTTLDALELLRLNDINNYNLVANYLGTIECKERGSGVYAWENPPRYVVGKATMKNWGLKWYTSTIVHDSYHSKLYNDYALLYKTLNVPYEVYSGELAEALCVKTQHETLLKIGADEYLINYIKQVMDSHWWEVDYNDRWW